MHARVRLFIVALFATLVPSMVAAQQATPANADRPAGPTIEATATAFRATTQADSTNSASPVQSRQNVGKPVALIIVGGAAIIVGAIIGDAPGTIFMIGGGVALLYGLYQYLK